MGDFSSFHDLGNMERAKLRDFPGESFNLGQSVESHNKQDGRNNKDERLKYLGVGGYEL